MTAFALHLTFECLNCRVDLLVCIVGIRSFLCFAKKQTTVVIIYLVRVKLFPISDRIALFEVSTRQI